MAYTRKTNDDNQLAGELRHPVTFVQRKALLSATPQSETDEQDIAPENPT